jgi:hypothetical protein
LKIHLIEKKGETSFIHRIKMQRVLCFLSALSLFIIKMNAKKQCDCCGTTKNLMHPTGRIYTWCSRCSYFHKDLMEQIRTLKKRIVKYESQNNNKVPEDSK